MDSIPEASWCTCKPVVEVDGKVYPPKQGSGTPWIRDGSGKREEAASA
jgi:hypothetical protein